MDFLTEAERQDINFDTQRKRSIALGRLSELAVMISDVERVVDAVRELEPRTAHRLGKAAQELLDQLERVGIVMVASDDMQIGQNNVAEQTEPTLAVPVVLIEETVVPDDEPVVQIASPQDVPTTPQGASPESLEESETSPNALTPAGLTWLKRVVGDDWREELDVTDEDTDEDIARKILSRLSSRAKSTETTFERILLRIQGKTPKEIGFKGLSVFEMRLKEKFAQRNTVESTEHNESDAVEDLNVSEVPEALSDPESLTPAGEKWLTDTIGEDWRVRLGVVDGDTPGQIAEKLVDRVNLRSENYRGPYLERTLLRIQGKTPLETSKLQGATATAVSQHSWQLKRRFALGIRDESDSRDAVPDAPTVVESQDALEVPQQATPTPRPHPRAPLGSILSAALDASDREEEKKRGAAELAALLQERTGITSTGRVGLISFLDSKSNGDMTDAKRFAVDAAASYLRPLLDSSQYDLTPEETRWIRTSFGVVTVNGSPVNKDPVPLKDLRRQALTRSSEHAARVETSIYSGLEKLLVGGPNARLLELRQADVVRAALEPAEIDDDEYRAIQGEVITAFESQFGEDATEQIKSALDSYPTVAVTKEMRGAFSTLRQLVLVANHGSTGWVQFDTALRDFLAISHPVGQQARAMTSDERKVNNRNVTAGIYIHLQNAQKEQAA